MEVSTVRITSPVSDDNPLGYIVINEEDFKEGTDELFVEKAAKKGKAESADKAAE